MGNRPPLSVQELELGIATKSKEVFHGFKTAKNRETLIFVQHCLVDYCGDDINLALPTIRNIP